MFSSTHPLIIIMPVYEDVDASTLLIEQLSDLYRRDAAILVVDDGSLKNSFQLSSLHQARISGAVVRLSRNVGHQRAISIGLSLIAKDIVPGQIVVVMDSDGEDTADSVGVLRDKLHISDVDVVFAARKKRHETLKFKLFYALYKRFFFFMTGRRIRFGNFMALNEQAVKRLACMQEVNLHVAAAVLASKLRTDECAIDRGYRLAGQSKMNFVGLLLHGFKALMVFAEDVVVRVGLACSLIAVFCLGGATSAVVLKLFGFSTPGWFSIALGILVLLFLQTSTLAMMMLMLTGVVRGATVNSLGSQEEFISEILISADLKR